jgi:hypothetical protein
MKELKNISEALKKIEQSDTKPTEFDKAFLVVLQNVSVSMCNLLELIKKLSDLVFELQKKIDTPFSKN